MRTDVHFSPIDFWIFLGIFQGIFISWFFIIKSTKNNNAKLFNGLLILFLSISILEEFLNNTGLILHVLRIKDFAEPFNFTFGPFFYLTAKSTLYPNKKQKTWPHLVIAIFWVLYMIFYFIQPIEVKYNSHIYTKQPDWELLKVVTTIDEDPLGIRNHVNMITGFHFSSYIIAVILITWKKAKEQGESIYSTNDAAVKTIRSSLFHFILIVGIFIFVKLYFSEDLGDFFIAAYITFVIYLTSYQILNNSRFFEESHSFMEIPTLKYSKSSLSGDKKAEILKKLNFEMETNKYFKNNLASLPDLAKIMGESKHHVSQVLNDKIGKSFYNLIAAYRIEEAKKIIKNDQDKNLTIEEIAEMVGYNSKSAFNNAFKSITSLTPSDFRKKHH